MLMGAAATPSESRNGAAAFVSSHGGKIIIAVEMHSVNTSSVQIKWEVPRFVVLEVTSFSETGLAHVGEIIMGSDSIKQRRRRGTKTSRSLLNVGSAEYC